MELPDLEKFLAVLVTTFLVVAATYLDGMKAFKADPKKSLQMLGTRLNLSALPLEGANLMKHLPNMLRMGTIRKMKRQDEKHIKRGEASTNCNELMFLARE